MNAEQFLGNESRKQVKTRRFGGKTYTFMLNRMKSVVDDRMIYYVTCITPENGFGYSDTVLRSTRGNAVNAVNEVYTMHRYLQPWIRREIAKEFTKIEIKFSIEVY